MRKKIKCEKKLCGKIEVKKKKEERLSESERIKKNLCDKKKERIKCERVLKKSVNFYFFNFECCVEKKRVKVKLVAYRLKGCAQA